MNRKAPEDKKEMQFTKIEKASTSLCEALFSYSEGLRALSYLATDSDIDRLNRTISNVVAYLTIVQKRIRETNEKGEES